MLTPFAENLMGPVIRAPALVIPAQELVIPTKAGIHTMETASRKPAGSLRFLLGAAVRLRGQGEPPPPAAQRLAIAPLLGGRADD